MIHTKLRNKLNNERVSKLIRVYRHLSRNEKKSSKELFLDQELNPALENLLFLEVDE